MAKQFLYFLFFVRSFSRHSSSHGCLVIINPGCSHYLPAAGNERTDIVVGTTFFSSIFR